MNEVIHRGCTGFICEDDDDMVRSLCATHTLDRHQCRAAVEEYFSAARMVSDHLELFKKLL